ncbi:MAG TPA: hypothetical protein VGN57_00125 [Pirellulaceae bacterium]|jgi:ElaB/YqjD/DUF883 family membrane-anchored ribosome-binding protein|nr:hypothetical protein [Pirellulaceae bacterium]
MAPGAESRELIAPEEARLARERELARLRADASAPSGALAEAERWIAGNPKYALGAGLAVGLLLGWWIKR